MSDDDRTDPGRQTNPGLVNPELRAVLEAAEEVATVKALKDFDKRIKELAEVFKPYANCASIIVDTWRAQVGHQRFGYISLGPALIVFFTLALSCWFFGINPYDLALEARAWKNGECVDRSLEPASEPSSD